MSKEYFTDNIKTETLAKLIDETLRYEKNKKGEPVRMSNIIKIVSAVAAIVLVFGFINIVLPTWNKNNEPDIAVSPDDANSYASSTTNPADIDRGELFLPEIIEKSFFEDKILAQITDTRALDKLDVYYTLKDPTDPDLSDRARKEMLVVYPMAKSHAIYQLSESSKREKDQLLSYIYDYTDITRSELVEMCMKIEYMPMEINERYAHVRFGENYFGKDYDILLLDIEWYTYDEYKEERLEPYKNYVSEFFNSDEYMQLSDEDKNYYKNMYENNIEGMENNLTEIADKSTYTAKKVNGKNTVDETGGFSVSNVDKDISENYDSEGYFIYTVYPCAAVVMYRDKDGFWQYTGFGTAYSKLEYDNILKNEIIPYCDNLLAQGLMNQEDYDYYKTYDPLEYCVMLYFD